MKTGVRRFKGSYLSYVMIYFFAYFSFASFSAVLSVYLTGVGKSATEMSLIVSSSGLFSFAVVPFAGFLCDRTGKSRQISGLLLIAMGLLALLFAYCRQVWMLFLLNGLIMSFCNATMPVSERLASACRFRYGVLRVWGTLGYAAGAQAAGVAIQSFPPVALFSLVLVTALLAALGYACAEDPAEEPAPSGDDGPKERAHLSSFLKNPQFLLYLVIAFFCAGCSGANMIYAPVLLDSMGMPTGAVGTVLSVSTLVEIPVILFSNKFMDRFSLRALLVAACTLFIVQYTLYGVLSSLWAVTAVMVLVKAISSTLMMMIVLKTVRSLVSPALTTTGLSVVNAVQNLGTIVLQNVGGRVTDLVGVQGLYLGMAGAVALALILSLFLRYSGEQKVFS